MPNPVYRRNNGIRFQFSTPEAANGVLKIMDRKGSVVFEKSAANLSAKNIEGISWDLTDKVQRCFGQNEAQTKSSTATIRWKSIFSPGSSTMSASSPPFGTWTSFIY